MPSASKLENPQASRMVTPQSREDKMREISIKLQEGWRLLQQTCPMPECGTPLLQDRESNVYCAGCQLFCVSAASVSGFIEDPPSGQLELLRGDGKATGDPLVDAVVSEEETLTVQRATRDQVSKLMGQRMLQGWTLLAESCGRCFHPFMSLRGGPMVCLQCEVEGVSTPAARPVSASAALGGKYEDQNVDVGGHQEDEDEEEEEEDEDEEDDAYADLRRFKGLGAVEAIFRQHAQPQATSGEALVVSEGHQGEDSSAFIGQKLLQGWALLGDACPHCVMPLMRDREAKLHCSGCRRVVAPKADTSAEESGHRIEPRSHAPASLLSSRASPSPSTASTVEPLSVSPVAVRKPSSPRASVPMATPRLSARGDVSATGRATFVATDADTHDDTISKALAAVYEGVRHMTTRLSQTPCDAVATGEAATALAKLADAAASLERLQGGRTKRQRDE